MRNMSFALTTQQILDETKDVTRRLGWDFVKPGDQIQACEKCQGLKKGESLRKLKVLEVVSVRKEPLEAITADDVRREGFPGESVEGFIARFIYAMRCYRSTTVNRIEFRYVK